MQEEEEVIPLGSFACILPIADRWMLTELLLLRMWILLQVAVLLSRSDHSPHSTAQHPVQSARWRMNVKEVETGIRDRC